MVSFLPLSSYKGSGEMTEEKRRHKGFDAFTIAMAVGTVLVAGFVFYKSMEASREAERSGPPVFFEKTAFGEKAEPAQLAGDFRLTSAAGEVPLSDFRGKTVVLFFGYTACPEACPSTLSKIAAALEEMGPEEADGVRVLFISFDPGRDTPELLAEYVAYFHPNMVGLTGETSRIKEVAAMYGAFFMKESAEEGAGEEALILFGHSTTVYIIDGEGRLADFVGASSDKDRFVAAIRGVALTGAAR